MAVNHIEDSVSYRTKTTCHNDSIYHPGIYFTFCSSRDGVIGEGALTGDVVLIN